MARTGQPATRQVAVVQRAVTILDELADAIPGGLNKVDGVWKIGVLMGYPMKDAFIPQ